MLSALFLIAAEFLLLHGWLAFEMPAERWKKLITLKAQSVSNALSLKKDSYGNCSADAQDFLGGTAGSSLMSVGFLLPVSYMRLCLMSHNCSNNLRRETGVKHFALLHLLCDKEGTQKTGIWLL